jgi:nucleoside-diphosphate-sugar epimerase
MDSRSKVVITGASGFTGKHLTNELEKFDYQVHPLKADLTDRDGVFKEIKAAQPNYVVHLGGISFAGSSIDNSIYDVNVYGTLNLLDALKTLNQHPDRVILASSAAVYGNVSGASLSEVLCPKPANHYGCSKLAMEHVAKNYFDQFPIIITRPFNYTGIGHSERFLIPKVIHAYRNKLPAITLGNLDISREFNDVRDVISVYRLLLLSEEQSCIVNICSGRSISLFEIIEAMNRISGLSMEVVSSQEFSRGNEIKDLSGDDSILKGMLGYSFRYQLEDTLKYMFNC